MTTGTVPLRQDEEDRRMPWGCYRSTRALATCSVCGGRPVVTHLPKSGGAFCSYCCPACSRVNSNRAIQSSNE